MASLLEKNMDCACEIFFAFRVGDHESGRERTFVVEWVATRHNDLGTIFLKIDYLIDGQTTEIKTTLEYSRLKEKDKDKSNPIIAQMCYNVSHLALRIIKEEIKRASKILVDPENLCGHWVRASHMLPCRASYLNDTSCIFD
ncbi:hypothetical protein M9H77_02972 [Catharanthus roseus]|uniref:Uncharacterized protein n=1 Tax=Catharanthus roseus TaxID=4058 RepID=A0ACC0CA31_CATRO|nr:hypothetical protein M9H77_02972 [Catharanthus roseus]